MGKKVAERGQELRKQAAERGQELKQQVAQKGQAWAQRLSSAWKQSGSTAAGATASTKPRLPSTGGKAKDDEEKSPSLGAFLSYLKHPGQMPATGPDSSGPESPRNGALTAPGEAPTPTAEAAAENGKASEGTTRGTAGEPLASSPVASSEEDRGVGGLDGSNGSAGSGGSGGSGGEWVHIAPAGNAVVVMDEEASEQPQDAEQSPAAAPTAAPAEEEKEDTDSTVLIEARITLDDGSVASCQVRAADRVKQVAARFVTEHSLKSCFEAPLKAYLAKAEADAVTFPVKLEADLMEIRAQHASRAT